MHIDDKIPPAIFDNMPSLVIYCTNMKTSCGLKTIKLHRTCTFKYLNECIKSNLNVSNKAFMVIKQTLLKLWPECIMSILARVFVCIIRSVLFDLDFW